VIPAVEAVQARYGSLPLTERLSGAVKARNQVELYPQISATVMQVFVQNGDLVSTGQQLVRLRDTEFQEQVKQAEASLQIASAQAKQAEAEFQRVQAELKRSMSLSEQNLISATEFEAIQTQAVAAEASAELARARVEQARATIDERREALSRTIVRAPVDGTVGNRKAEVGMLVNPNSRLFTLGQLDSMRIEVVLSDRMLMYIKEDQRSEILSPSLPFGSISAPVARISPFLHPVAHSTTAEIDLPNPEQSLKPGMFVTVDIFYGESDKATLVPLSALWESPANASVGVFICRDSLDDETVQNPQDGALTEPARFEFVPVEVIAKGRMNAGVRGIESGSWVVTIGQDLLGADTSSARVRPVSWKWVEDLQLLQREDLIEDIIRKQGGTKSDSSLIGELPADHREAAA
jgi:RND family efflux transporter MFP subunit